MRRYSAKSENKEKMKKARRERESRPEVVEKRREYQRQYSKKNRGEINQKQREWRARNPNKVKEYLVRWRKNNPEKFDACRKKWRADNPEYYKKKNRRDQAARRAAQPKWADRERIKEIYANCPEGQEVDHIIPINGGIVCGLHVPENLQYLSADENKRKGNTFR